MVGLLCYGHSSLLFTLAAGLVDSLSLVWTGLGGLQFSIQLPEGSQTVERLIDLKAALEIQGLYIKTLERGIKYDRRIIRRAGFKVVEQTHRPLPL